jgi:hypothetical protein
MFSKYDVTVSWAKPVLQPTYFIVKAFKGNDHVLNDDDDTEEKIVEGVS